MTTQTQRALSRAQVIRGRFFGRDRAPARPPWTVGQGVFAERCTACGDCVDACPEGILVRGARGIPEVNFGLGECTFCGSCADSCRAGALHAPRDGSGVPRVPWSASVRIGDGCLSARGVVCRICAEQCEARAIRFADPRGHGRPLADPESCTGCGACVAPCPARAIEVEIRPISEEEQRA